MNEYATSPVRRQPRSAPCDLYLVEAAGTHCIKVGVSQCFGGRISTLQTGCPYQLETIWIFGLADRDTAELCERTIHDCLAEHRVQGEWFQVERPIAFACALTVIQSNGIGRIKAKYDYNYLMRLARMEEASRAFDLLCKGRA